MIHWSTKNESFLKMQKLLENNGIRNNTFFLHLENPALEHVDPFTVTDRDIAKAIIEEITINPYYFPREIFRIASESGEMSPFLLDIAALSSMFLTFQCFNIYREQSRQTGKTTWAAGELDINWNVRCRNADIAIVNFDDTAAKENLQKVIEYSEYLPEYLKVFKLNVKEHSDNSIDIEDSGEIGKTVKVATNKIFGNRLIAKTVGTTPAMANKVGKGGTFSIEFFDEVAVYPNLELVLGAAAPAFKTASDNAKKGGFPSYIYLTSTPPDMGSPQGEYLYRLVKVNALKFEPYMFDLSTAQLKALQKSVAKNSYFYVSYSYKELGFSDEWALEHFENSGSQWLFERDILLKWKKNLKESPYSPIDLEKIERMVYDNKNYIAIPMIFEMTDFVEFGAGNLQLKSKLDKLMDTVLECKIFPLGKMSIADTLNKYKFDRISLAGDVSAGYGGDRDSSTLCASDPTTGETIFTFKSNLLDPTIFALVIYYVIKKYFPNALLVIERNSYGEAVISELRYTSIERNLYYTTKTPDMVAMNDKLIKKGDLVYGIYNIEKIRHILFSIICSNMVKNFKRIIKSFEIYEEISTLVLKNDRIDHKAGCHDDLLIAKLLSLYPLLYDNNLEAFFKIAKLVLVTDEMQALIDAGLGGLVNQSSEKEEYEKQIEKLNKPGALLTINDVRDLIDMDINGKHIAKIQERFNQKVKTKDDYDIPYKSSSNFFGNSNKTNKNDPYR